jgi:hypothetical protein
MKIKFLIITRKEQVTPRVPYVRQNRLKITKNIVRELEGCLAGSGTLNLTHD